MEAEKNLDQSVDAATREIPDQIFINKEGLETPGSVQEANGGWCGSCLLSDGILSNSPNPIKIIPFLMSLYMYQRK